MRGHRLHISVLTFLLAGSPVLAGSGGSWVEFVDATRAFEAHPETLYVDSCCHFGPRGNEILAELVAGAMRERDPQPRDARGVTRPR